jgi:CDP-diacylglycerol--glycerol-3-phosphate 3-phosphatidyltransferase
MVNQKFFDNIIAKTFLRFIPKSVLPNQVTVLRFILIPLVAYFFLIGEQGWSFAIFIIAALTDAVDGAMARTRDQITEWGEFYDPLADKILIGTVVVLVVAKYIGPVIAIFIIGIEAFLIIEALYLKLTFKKRIKALTVGKVKMAMQVIAVIFLFIYIFTGWPLFFYLALWLFYAAIIFAIASLFVYRSI